MPPTLADIDARLARIEAVVDRLADVMDQAPGVMSMAGDAIDETLAHIEASGSSVDERVQRVVHLLGQLTEPSTLEAFDQMVAMAQQAPQLQGFIAFALDSVDDVVSAASQDGIDIDKTLADVKASGVLRADSLEFLLETAGAVAAAGRETAPDARLGLFGLMRATRDPEVQRALAFLIDVARRLGSVLDTQTRPLALPEH